MTRRAHDINLVRRAFSIRESEGLGYTSISKRLWKEFGVSVGASTVRDWLAYYSRPLGRAA